MTAEEGIKLINQKYKQLQKELASIKKAQVEILTKLAAESDKKRMAALKSSIK